MTITLPHSLTVIGYLGKVANTKRPPDHRVNPPIPWVSINPFSLLIYHRYFVVVISVNIVIIVKVYYLTKSQQFPGFQLHIAFFWKLFLFPLYFHVSRKLISMFSVSQTNSSYKAEPLACGSLANLWTNVLDANPNLSWEKSRMSWCRMWVHLLGRDMG